jgi:hypothetical protein
MMEMTDLLTTTGNNHDDDTGIDHPNNDNIDLEENALETTTIIMEENSDDEEEEEEEEGRSLLSNHREYIGSLKRKRSRSRTTTRTRTTSLSPYSNIWQRHWLGNTVNTVNDKDEEPWIWYRHGQDEEGVLVLDATLVKFFKFVMIALGCLLLVHAYVWLVNDKRDVTYGLREMVLYDSNLIALDITVWFVIGRMYQQSSVDTLEFVFPTLLSAILQSFLATNVSSLQHSITAVEIACHWTWQMWALVWLGVVPLLLCLGGAHAITAYRQGQAIPKLIEVTVSLLVFLAPSMMMIESQFFHLHHWYYAWLIGMHCNIDTWWSRLCRNVLFGIYINGVAIFGRDPIMTCALSLYQSQSQECYYILSDYVNYTVQELAHDSGMDIILSPITTNGGGCNATTTNGGSGV